MARARKGFRPGVQEPSTPSQGTGSYAPTEYQASVVPVEPPGKARNTRVPSGAHSGPSAVVTQRQTTGPKGPNPVPKMTFTSPDGVVTRPRKDTQNGWYDNSGIREVED
jgi:hypothetical protein